MLMKHALFQNVLLVVGVTHLLQVELHCDSNCDRQDNQPGELPLEVESDNNNLLHFNFHA